MYQEFQPHPLLHPYIKTYWVSGSFAGEEITQRNPARWMCGYYDHARLIREFKRLLGYTPREL